MKGDRWYEDICLYIFSGEIQWGREKMQIKMTEIKEFPLQHYLPNTLHDLTWQYPYSISSFVTSLVAFATS